MSHPKEIRWIGSAYDDLMTFPSDVRRQAGFQLSKIQFGLDPSDWKPYDVLGSGLREIRIRDASGAYRIMYVARFEEAIYVLHCFCKKSRTTGRQDRIIAETRYRAMIAARANP